MSLTRPAKILLVATVLLAVGHEALAQSSPPGVSKLGAPAMAAPSTAPLADPGTLFNYSNSVGRTLRILVVGNIQGSVWGDGVYTSDSVLAAAVVHAGLLQPGESGIVSVELLEGLPAYDGAERHAVTSLAYGAWNVAYRLTGVEKVGSEVVLPDPGSLTNYRGQNGSIFKFDTVGSVIGSVWGDGVYTDDSVLAAAAVHSGVLRADEAGVVAVEILPGQTSYGSSAANGVTSAPYADWGGSYRILSPHDSKINSKLAN